MILARTASNCKSGETKQSRFSEDPLVNEKAIATDIFCSSFIRLKQNGLETRKGSVEGVGPLKAFLTKEYTLWTSPVFDQVCIVPAMNMSALRKASVSCLSQTILN